MRPILLLVLSLSVAPLACDFNAALTTYCARANACTCTEIGCCLHEGVHCGGPNECCPGSVCSEEGVCVPGQRPVLQLLPDPVAFPRLGVGASSGPVNHVVRNEGLLATSLLISSVVGDPGAFEIGDGCSGSVLEPGAECTIEVTYRPTSAGSHAALLTLTEATEILSVPMSGQAGLPVSILLRGGGAGRVLLEPAGTTCPYACIALVEPGQVRLVAHAVAPSEFTGFSHPGCAGGSSVCDLSISEATQVEATFVAGFGSRSRATER